MSGKENAQAVVDQLVEEARAKLDTARILAGMYQIPFDCTLVEGHPQDWHPSSTLC
jgi:hypothetical protein